MIEPQYRLIAALDVEGFGNPTRTNVVRLELHRRLRRLCSTLLRRAGISRRQYVAHDTGDGLILSIDGTVAKLRLLTRFVPDLAAHLTATNDGRPEQQQMRLRMALHAGDVLADPQPLHGEAVIFATRLLDADVVRACLAATTMPLALIVSEAIYQETIKHFYEGITPDDYLLTVAESKETCAPAWMHIPGDRNAPQRVSIVSKSDRLEATAAALSPELR